MNTPHQRSRSLYRRFVVAPASGPWYWRVSITAPTDNLLRACACACARVEL